LPASLDFRYKNFEEKYVDLIEDILLSGSEEFIKYLQQVESDDEVAENMRFVSNQFLSYKTFSERVNQAV